MKIIMDGGSSKDRATAGLAVHLLLERVESTNLEHELNYLESFLADRLANALLEDVDWDRYDWSS